jgi:hypothetical protein
VNAEHPNCAVPCFDAAHGGQTLLAEIIQGNALQGVKARSQVSLFTFNLFSYFCFVIARSLVVDDLP